MSLELSIVIPCYNEEKNIELVIKKLEKILKNEKVELILVDNGSSDNTQKEIKKYTKIYPSIKLVIIKKNIGYGNGIFQGLKSTRGTFLSWNHADLQIDPLTALRGLEIIKKQPNPENTFVKGNRKGRSFLDKFFEVGMSFFETIILGTYLYDINAQPNLFHKSLMKSIKDPPKDFSFDLYVYYIAKLKYRKVIRFPVKYYRRIHGHSTWNFGLSSRFKLVKRTISFTFKLKKYLRKQKIV